MYFDIESHILFYPKYLSFLYKLDVNINVIWMIWIVYFCPPLGLVDCGRTHRHRRPVNVADPGEYPKPPRGLQQPPGECSFGDQTSCPQNTSPTQQYTVTHLIKTYFANSLLEKLHGFEHDLSLFLYCVYNFNFNIINYKQKTKAFSRLYKYIRGAFNQECESIHKIRMN